MNLCTTHWEALKGAIRARGLFHLVSTGKKLPEVLLEGNFEPLLGAAFLITVNALELVGTTLLLRDPATGEAPCPLCFLNVEHAKECHDPTCPAAEGFDDWVDRAADQAYEEARRLGLVMTA